MIEIRKLFPENAAILAQVYSKNRDNFKPFEPLREAEFYTALYHQKILEEEVMNPAICRFGIWQGKELVGQVKLSQILRGAAQSAVVGYFIDIGQRKKGYMSMAVQHAVEVAFSEMKLHRLQASVMPSNLPSIGVLEKCGFERIGLANKYLLIQGVWEDHYLYQRCKEE